ncbi:hypothetical protein FSP39_024588 [Pinctada imbricata]|uniref:non-specific serine/threonine protein kinase n=1 Tax=Pinctada imbricata TaxID=66713 RepID=A0AA89C045_PINIB|nr:hypothetical protein FSP39_024588 [Pinctada imbricata]
METICFISSNNANCNQSSVQNLQDICRSVILEKITLKNIQQVADLPLPQILKEFIGTFHIDKDFNLDGIYEEYNFNFPNHVHHKAHQIHPAKCVINGENVLLRYQSIEDCTMCNNVGILTPRSEETREKWAYLRHDNLMQCHLRMYDQEKNVSFSVLDFPIINLEDLVIRTFVERKQIPEMLIWDTVVKLSSVLQYLTEKDIYPWELCQPRHVVVGINGNVMLENMLLYLPVKSDAPYQIETCARLSNYTSPEQLKGQPLSPKTLIWGLGCIINELALLFPTSLQRTENLKLVLPSSAKTRSPALRKLIQHCLQEDFRCRPMLKEVEIIAKLELNKATKLYGKYEGNLLSVYTSHN